MAKSAFFQLRDRLENCSDCNQDSSFEPRPIVWGNPKAKIVQISQAPSKKAHETRKPFNDLSGVRLRRWYSIGEEVFYNKNLFYMTAISHCFPGKDGNGGDRRPPLKCAKKWLEKELDAVQNLIYLIIGSSPASFLFPRSLFHDLVFSDQELNEKPAFVLPHPSPLNIKWFKDNPDFIDGRLPEVREVIAEIVRR